MTGHTAQTGHNRALDTERESQVTHGDLDHGVRVHLPNFAKIHPIYIEKHYYQIAQIACLFRKFFSILDQSCTVASNLS